MPRKLFFETATPQVMVFDQLLQHGLALRQGGQCQAAQVFLQAALGRWEEAQARGGDLCRDLRFASLGRSLRTTLGMALADAGVMEEALEAFTAAGNYGKAIKFLAGHCPSEDRLLTYLQASGVAALVEITPLLRRRFAARDYRGAFQAAQSLPFYSGAPHQALLPVENTFGKLDLLRALHACVLTRGVASIATLECFLVHLHDRDPMDPLSWVPVPQRFCNQPRLAFRQVVVSLYGSWEETLLRYRAKTASKGQLQNLHEDSQVWSAAAQVAPQSGTSEPLALLTTILGGDSGRAGIQRIFGRLAEGANLQDAREDILRLPSSQSGPDIYNDRALEAIDILAGNLEEVLARPCSVETRLMVLQCLDRELTAADLARMAWLGGASPVEDEARRHTAQRRIELFTARSLGRSRILDLYANPSRTSRFFTSLAQVACQTVVGLVSGDTLRQLEFRFEPGSVRELRVRVRSILGPSAWIPSLLTRDIHDECKVREGIPLEGEGWVSQGAMVALLRRLFAPSVVLTEASPEGIGAQRFDAFIPDLRLAVEYQGEQHDWPLSHWGGEEGLRQRQEADLQKAENARRTGIRIEYIYYDEDLPGRCLEIADKALRSVRSFTLAGTPGGLIARAGRPIDRRVLDIARHLRIRPEWRATLAADPAFGSNLERQQALAVTEALAAGVRDPEDLAMRCPDLRMEEPYPAFAARVIQALEILDASSKRPRSRPGMVPEDILMDYYRDRPEAVVKAMTQAGCAPVAARHLLTLNRDYHLDFRAAFELHAAGQGILLIDLYRLLGRIQPMLWLA